MPAGKRGISALSCVCSGKKQQAQQLASAKSARSAACAAVQSSKHNSWHSMRGISISRPCNMHSHSMRPGNI
eukprot:356720-Chlamydomonas_euryale.AAC.2